MSVARVHHNKDYTCMSNYHFQDRTLSLKAKGLLSLMLSLPDTWDYSVAGLATLSSDGETSVRTAVKELEEHNYLQRTPVREGGRIIDWEYDIYEQPREILDVENQQVEKLSLDSEYNKVSKQSNTKKVNTSNSKELLQSQDFQFGKSKPKKSSLYTKCVSLIDEKTDDVQVRKLLIDWLNMLLEKYKSRGKVLYVNVFKGKLNMIDKFDRKDWRDIVEYNIQRGYEGLYPISPYASYDPNNAPHERGLEYTHMTQEEFDELVRNADMRF